MIQIFRNPIINALLLNLNQTFWIEYFSKLNPQDVTSEGLLNLNQYFHISYSDDLKSNVSNFIPFVKFQHYFSQDKNVYEGLNKNIDEVVNFKIIRTISLILKHLNSFCFQLELAGNVIVEDTFNSTGFYNQPRNKQIHLSILQTVFNFSNYTKSEFEKKHDHLFEISNYCNYTPESVNNISYNSVFNSLYVKENVSDNFYYLIDSYFCPICINVYEQHGYRKKLEPKDVLGRILFRSYYGPLLTEKLIEVTFVSLSALCTISGVIVYVWCPKLRNTLHGKIMMHHIIAIAGYYTSQAITKIYYDVQDNSQETSNLPCFIGGAVVWYFLLTTLFWLNSIFIDMLIKFGGITFIYEEIKLSLYSVFSWIVPIFIVLITLTYGNLYNTDTTLSGVDFLCGLEYFSFSNIYFDSSSYLFVRSLQWTVTVSLSLNVIMTAIIMLVIYKQTKRSALLNSGESRTINRADTARLSIYVKLLSLTGFYWIISFMLMRIQVLYWAEGPTGELVTKHIFPLLNNLTGTIAFIILICTHNTVKVVNDKVARLMLARGRSMTVSTQQLTQTTSM